MAFHRLEDVIEIVAEHGYRGIGLTLDYHHLDPTDRDRAIIEAQQLKPLITDFGLRVTIETGARYILNPRKKHQPTLISPRHEDRAQRIALLNTAIDVAHELDAECVSLWSGATDMDVAVNPNDTIDCDGAQSISDTIIESDDALMDRLIASVRGVLDYARPLDVRLAFEPEPGMLIDTMDRFATLHDGVDDSLLGLTLDVTHVHCLSDGDVGDHIRRWQQCLWNVHIADMHRGVHEHLMFGDGSMNYPPIFESLHDIHYTGPVHVELSRHSHIAIHALQQSYAFLNPMIFRAT